jgi:hypothetical protein
MDQLYFESIWKGSENTGILQIVGEKKQINKSIISMSKTSILQTGNCQVNTQSHEK